MDNFKKSPKVDLKLIYNNILNAGMLLSLLLLIFSFYSFQTFDSGVILPDKPECIFEIIDIPIINRTPPPSPPQKPSIPVETEDEEIPDAVTIEENIFALNNVNDFPLPPPEKDEDVFAYYAVSHKPVIIHREVPIYPEFAKKAGIQGNVVITVTIDKKGNVENAKVFRSIPMLDDAALKAAKKCKFKPARQMDKFVKVKMSIPFTFKLK